jgi:hypothetical protein
LDNPKIPVDLVINIACKIEQVSIAVNNGEKCPTEEMGVL